MEIKRKIYDKLLDWKKEYDGKKALLIEGARRIGKSTVAEELGKNEYKSYILIDFNVASKNIKENFENLNDLDKFFQTLMIECNKKLYKRESLIIFDEIQKFPRAREAIKYLVQDGRYDFIETGSLISIKENVENITIPSEELNLKMYPVDFEEFLHYMNEDILIDYIKECYKNKTQLENAFHKKAMHLFYEYLLVGGMPKVLVEYKNNNKDFDKADKEKRAILKLYKDDINKAARKYKSKVAAIFNNLPSFLSKHEKRIVINNLSNEKTFDKYDEPLFWLDDSMICNVCYKTNDPNVGLSLNLNNSFVKCYMGDTGLLFSLAFNENEINKNELYKQILHGKLSLNEGMLFENVIAQMIVSKNNKLYFYTKYNEKKKRNDIEIDFILTTRSNTKFKIMPVEVKSSKNYTNTSLTKFNEKFKGRIGKSVIVHPKGFMVEDDLIKLPPYMFALVIDELLNE